MSQVNHFAFLLQGTIRGLEHLDNPEAGRAVIDGSSAVANTIDEMIDQKFQGFGLVEPGGPHVTRPIADQQVVDTFLVRDLHPFVIHPDLYVGVQIVPDQHLLLAADQGGPDFNRRQPVNVDVGDQVFREIEGHVG